MKYTLSCELITVFLPTPIRCNLYTLPVMAIFNVANNSLGMNCDEILRVLQHDRLILPYLKFYLMLITRKV